MGVSKVVYGDNTLVDLTNDSVSETTLAKGVTAHNAAGDQVTGTMEAGTSVTKETITEALGYTPTKAWYVTFTTDSDNNIITDKTVAEIYQAYQDGYAVYGLAENMVFHLSAIDSDSALFSRVYNVSGAEASYTVEWDTKTLKWNGVINEIYNAELINSILAAGVKNPKALTINSGGTAITYDGSEAKTIDIGSSGAGQSPLIVNVKIGDVKAEFSKYVYYSVTSVDKTFTQIRSAYNEGNVIIARTNYYGDLQLNLCDDTGVSFYLSSVDDEDCIYTSLGYISTQPVDNQWQFCVTYLGDRYATKAEIPDESTLVNKVLAALPTWTGGSY